jgi:hypothetical protein
MLDSILHDQNYPHFLLKYEHLDLYIGPCTPLISASPSPEPLVPHPRAPQPADQAMSLSSFRSLPPPAMPITGDRSASPVAAWVL